MERNCCKQAGTAEILVPATVDVLFAIRLWSITPENEVIVRLTLTFLIYFDPRDNHSVTSARIISSHSHLMHIMLFAGQEGL